MFTSKSQPGAKGTFDYRAQRPLMVAPEIKKEFFLGKGKDRTRMYETKDGKEFIADTYDFNFKVLVKPRLLPKGHKSKSLDSRVID